VVNRKMVFAGVLAAVLIAGAAVWLLRPGREPSAPRQAELGSAGRSNAAVEFGRPENVPTSASPPESTKSAPIALGSVSRLAKLEFDQADDLYSLSTAALSSADRKVVLNGWWAAMACNSSGPSHGELESISAGLDFRGGSTSQPQREAAKLILSRCRGFYDNQGTATTELRSALKRRLLEFGDMHVAGVSTGAPTAVQVKQILVHRDWQTFSTSMSDFLPAAAKKLGIAPVGKEVDLLGMAWIGASCDLGKDCSPNGLVRASQCALSANCDYAQDQNWLRDLPAEERTKVERYRRWIVDNFLAANAAAFMN